MIGIEELADDSSSLPILVMEIGSQQQPSFYKQNKHIKSLPWKILWLLNLEHKLVTAFFFLPEIYEIIYYYLGQPPSQTDSHSTTLINRSNTSHPFYTICVLSFHSLWDPLCNPIFYTHSIPNLPPKPTPFNWKSLQFLFQAWRQTRRARANDEDRGNRIERVHVVVFIFTEFTTQLNDS